MLKFIRRLLGDRPHRYAWSCHYGCFESPIDTVWIDRNYEHGERQRKLDASQNVMTRLL
jgi:hypothetical protein